MIAFFIWGAELLRALQNRETGKECVGLKQLLCTCCNT